MIKQSSPIGKDLNPREEAKVRLDQKDNQIQPTAKSKRRDFPPIFWEERSKDTGLIEKIRSILWFLPDYIFNTIHKTRPFSYMIFYGILTLLSWQAVTYASNTPESLFNYTPKQTLNEAAVGKVEMLNPLFITHNQLERDLQELIFNSLVTIGPDGIPQRELADSWAVSADGKTYTFFIREDVYWHDGERLTADDVVFTFETIQKLTDEDSFASAFEDVNIGKLDDFTIIFDLPEKNATFMENLTVGIVPKHLLENVRNVDMRTAVFNSYPTGTGPFIVQKNFEDVIVLVRNVNYFQGTPKLEKITYNLYSDEETLVQNIKQFQHHTFTNPTANALKEMEDYQVYETKDFIIHLRDKLIFLNLRNKDSTLHSEDVRRALSLATDRQAIIEAIGTGGEIALGPISKYSWAFNKSLDRYTFDIDRANKILRKAGWDYPEQEGERAPYREKNGKQLSVKLSLLDSEINTAIADELKQQWELIGVNLIIDTQTYEKIASETISRRDFEALLFEVETTPDPDKYNFWHSIKAEYPGLNLSGYSYQRVDILLERARREPDRAKRKEDYDLMQKYIVRDVPAIFLYHPTYKFIAHKSIKGISLENVSLPHQRYNNVHEWYIAKE